MSRSNRTNTYEITLSTGEVFTDRAKDSLGGVVNLLNRIALRIGSPERPRLTWAQGLSADFVCGAVTGTIRPVEVLK